MIDPKPGIKIVLPKVAAALEGGVDVIQLWNHWNTQESHADFITEVCSLARPCQVPVLIHEHWRWLEQFPLDGVHFDSIPENFNQIKDQIKRPFHVGITCGNDHDRIQWAIDNKLDYISFCSLFHSSTSNSCELVRPDLIKQTCASSGLTVFAAGGITHANVSSVMSMGVSGVAVVSTVMKADDPKIAAQKFKESMVRQNIL